MPDNRTIGISALIDCLISNATNFALLIHESLICHQCGYAQ